MRVPSAAMILLSQGETIMPPESLFFVTAVTVAFVGFALVLWWAERQTRDLHGKPQ
jgi:hypothetical protein